MIDIKTDLLEIKAQLIPLIKRPIETIRKLPDWPWRRLILAQVIVTMISGVLSGLIHLSFRSVLFGFFLMPFITLITVSISTLFFFYLFQIVNDRVIEFRRLFTAVFFANIPFFIFQTISAIFPPISLVGLAFTGVLLVVAFVDNFQLEKRFVLRLIAAIYLLFVVFSMINFIQSQMTLKSWRSGESYERAPEVPLGK